MSYVSHRRWFLNSLGLIASGWPVVPKLVEFFAKGEEGSQRADEKAGGSGTGGEVGIQVPKDASPVTMLAAKETARYLYLRTGKLLTITSSDSRPKNDVVIIAPKNWPGMESVTGISKAASTLQAQQYMIKSDAVKGGKQVWIVGGDDVGALYGAYRFLGEFDIRFYLHQDVIPEEKIELSLPDADETGKPVFELRGLNPWGSHAEGIDLWNADEYKAVISQMAKMRMNIMLIHSYPPYEPYLGYEQLTAEPGIWVGLPQDVDEHGHVRFSNTASYWNTARSYVWGYSPKKTGDYRFGGSLLFESDEWGSEVMNGQFPYATTPEGRNEVFNRAGEMFREVFTFARALGMKTGLGTEGAPPTPWLALSKKEPGNKLDLRQYGPPIMISEEIQQHLRALKKNPEDPAVIEEVYEGVFYRIMKTHPLDYYMIFSQESWYWFGYDEQIFDLLVEEWKLALKAWEKLKPPFGLASCGWVLGPDFDHAALDKVLPKHVALSAQERAYNGPVDEAYGRIKGRQKWAMPWLEEDSSNAIRELWAGRSRKAAADALAYGCTGLIPVMWRTLANEAPAAAVAEAGWDQSGWNPEFGKEHPLPPISTLYVEGPVSRDANVLEVGWTPDATPTGSIPEPQAITGTDDGPIYRTFWRDLLGYRLRVPKGRYRVTLKFIEPLYNVRGERVFNVAFQGRTVLESLDIFARSGRFRASDYSFEGIEVTKDGWLRIDFKAIKQVPLLCGIEVTGEGYRRLVKCGGGDYKDFKGDKLEWSRLPRLLWGKPGSSFEPRGLPVDDLYADWARANFGSQVAGQAGALFASIDTNFPLISTWTGVNGGGAGGFEPDQRPWEYVKQEFEFVDQFAKLRQMVRGTANLERFDSWLNYFLSILATVQAKCIWGRLENALKQARQEEDPQKRQKFAAQVVLPIYEELVARVGEAYRLLLVSIADIGGMEKVLNWEGHNNLMGIEKTGQEIAEILGQALPPEAVAAKEYQGEPRLIVPTVRTLLEEGEALKLKVIVLDNQPAKSVAFYWRTLGRGEFRKQDLTHVARGVYRVTLPSVENDFEYYIAAETAGGKKLVWPVTAPEMSQTVLTWVPPRP